MHRLLSEGRPVAAVAPATTSTLDVVARNTRFNFGGQVTVAAAALACTPFALRALGADAYGLISLAMATFGLSSVLDFGLGRATTNFVASCLSRGDRAAIGSIVFGSCAVQTLMGIVFGVLLFFGAGLISPGLLKTPPALQDEVFREFAALGLGFPFVLVGTSLRGVLEGVQRFDLVNFVKVPINMSTYVVPVIGAYAGLRVSSIVVCLVILRAISAGIYLALCRSVLRPWRPDLRLAATSLTRVVKYAGWVSVSNLIIPVLVQIDRYMVATLTGVAAVAYYAIPLDMLNGLFIIPASLCATVFPAISALPGGTRDQRLPDLYARPLKYILISLSPVAITLCIYSRELLSWWQGPVFAAKASVALQLLCVGGLINALGWVPGNAIMALGRPDLTAKIHMVQLPLYLGLAYVLISRLGIVGAAAAFTVRVTGETAALLAISGWLSPSSRHPLSAKTFSYTAAIIALFAVTTILVHATHWNPISAASAVLTLLLTSAAAFWFCVFDETDKRFVRVALAGLR